MPLDIMKESRIPAKITISEAKKVTLAKEDILRHGLKEGDTIFEVVLERNKRKNITSLEHLDRKVSILEKRKKQIMGDFDAKIESVKTLRNDLAKRG